MRRVIVLSRCEISSTVYLPGDELTVTEEQFQVLLGHNAVKEIPFRASMPVFNPANATIADADKFYQQLVGQPRPVKGNVK